MAISVELGPGTRLEAPSMSREICVGNPAAPANELLFHHRDVSRRAAEGGGAQSQERERNLLQRRAGSITGCGCGAGGSLLWRAQSILPHLRTVRRTARGLWFSLPAATVGPLKWPCRDGGRAGRFFSQRSANSLRVPIRAAGDIGSQRSAGSHDVLI